MSVLRGKLIDTLFNRFLVQKGLSVMMSSEVRLVLSCRKCRKEIGEVSEDELKFCVQEDERGPLCFDCEPDLANLTPNLFWQWKAGELIDIGDSRFCVTADEEQIVEVGFVPPHERGRVRNLSSYTYLNRTQEKTLLLQNGYEVRMCQECQGTGLVLDYDWSSDCPICGGSGSLYEAFYIPKWVIEGDRDA